MEAFTPEPVILLTSTFRPSSPTKHGLNDYSWHLRYVFPQERQDSLVAFDAQHRDVG